MPCFRDGCTAIVAVGQPTTDICSFFSRAYILVNGEVVYFGDTGGQAMGLLASAGMPCPPLYSPVEQYIRLVDNTFEVPTVSYMQALTTALDSEAKNPYEMQPGLRCVGHVIPQVDVTLRVEF